MKSLVFLTYATPAAHILPEHRKPAFGGHDGRQAAAINSGFGIGAGFVYYITNTERGDVPPNPRLQSALAHAARWARAAQHC